MEGQQRVWIRTPDGHAIAVHRHRVRPRERKGVLELQVQGPPEAPRVKQEPPSDDGPPAPPAGPAPVVPVPPVPPVPAGFPGPANSGFPAAGNGAPDRPAGSSGPASLGFPAAGTTPTPPPAYAFSLPQRPQRNRLTGLLDFIDRSRTATGASKRPGDHEVTDNDPAHKFQTYLMTLTTCSRQRTRMLESSSSESPSN